MDNDTPRPQPTAQERQHELSDQQLESVSGGIVGTGGPPRPSAPPPNLADQIRAHLRYSPMLERPTLKRSNSAHF